MEKMTVETPEALQLIGTLAVRFRLLTEEQLMKALAESSGKDKEGRPGQTLVDLGFINEGQLNFLIDTREMKILRNKDIKFGAIAVDHGFVTPPQVEDVLQRQKHHFIKYKKKSLIGDILVADGTISEDQRQTVIKEQQRIILARNIQVAAAEKLAAKEARPLSTSEGVELIVSMDRLKATLRAAPEIDHDKLRTRIDELVQEYAITFGKASDEDINKWITQGKEREVFLVLARGVPPVAGHSGEINYHFDTDPLKAGKIKDGDVIDFKDRGETPQVEEGAVLAELTEADPGVAGTDVHGEAIPAPMAKEKKLLAGDGAALSADGRSVRAKIDGSPSIARRGAIVVLPLHQVKGNVGYKTGHVDFDGEIKVNGTVEKDFKVTGGKLTANEIEDAEVTIKGDVVVSGGILGGHIKAGGNVLAAYIHNAVVEAGGDILVQKEIMGCDIKTGGGVYSETCIILDSRIAAKAGVIAGDIGSEASGPSKIMVGSDAILELHITEVSNTIEVQRERQRALRKQIEEHEAENKQINIDISEVAQIQDRSQVEQRELGEQREVLVAQGEAGQAEELAKQIAEGGERAKKAEEDLNTLFDRQDEIAAETPQLEQQIAEIEAFLHDDAEELKELQEQMKEEQADVYVKVVGTIFPMTTITTAHTSVKTKQEMKSLIIREKSKRKETGEVVWKIVTESLS
jgi:uncharacterized protein (DUF342 family)